MATTPHSGDITPHSIDEACKRLGIGRNLIYKEIGSGRLRSHKAGRRRIITEGGCVDYVGDREAEELTRRQQ